MQLRCKHRFATRAPHRPAPVSLSALKLIAVDEDALELTELKQAFGYFSGPAHPDQHLNRQVILVLSSL